MEQLYSGARFARGPAKHVLCRLRDARQVWASRVLRRFCRYRLSTRASLDECADREIRRRRRRHVEEAEHAAGR